MSRGGRVVARRRLVTPLLALAPLALLAGCDGGAAEEGITPVGGQDPAATVEILATGIEPELLTVERGDVVVFVSGDDGLHDFTIGDLEDSVGQNGGAQFRLDLAGEYVVASGSHEATVRVLQGD